MLFRSSAIDEKWLDKVCENALWSPTAGNSAGVRIYIVSKEHVASYFEVATDKEWRESSKRSEALMRCGAVVIITSRPNDYIARYAEDDKAKSGLSEKDAWPIPYWHTDAAMAAMALLLLVEEAGLQATIWGNFRNDAAVLSWAGVKDEELFATILIGRGDGNDVASKSLQRDVPSRSDRVRRVQP